MVQRGIEWKNEWKNEWKKFIPYVLSHTE